MPKDMAMGGGSTGTGSPDNTGGTRPLLDSRMGDRLGWHYWTTCDIQAATETRGEAGGVSEAWANVSGLEDLRCMIMPAATDEAEGELTTTIATHRLGFREVHATITTEHRVVDADGVVYDIVGVSIGPQVVTQVLDLSVVSA